MGSAMLRRFAFVAAMVLLAPVWFRPAAVAHAAGSPGATVIGLAPAGAPPGPAIRRHTTGGWWLAGSRLEYGRALVVLAAVALLSVFRRAPWAILAASRSVPAPLARRRHIIALRAPPFSTCTP